MTGLPDDAPDGLRDALDGAKVTRFWREGTRAYGYAGGGRFVRWSGEPGDAAVLAHEAVVRDAIGPDGVLRAPPVLARGPGWLLERAVAAGPVAGERAIDAAVAAAGALAALELPELDGAPERSGGRLATARRNVRLVRGPIARDLLAARRLLARTPLPLVTSHGDFHAGNLLMDGDRPWVVDWELVGRRPAAFDLMQLWPTLGDPADREHLLEAAVALVGEPMRDHVLALRYVLVVRTIASKLVPAHDFNADTAGARELLAQLPALRPRPKR